MFIQQPNSVSQTCTINLIIDCSLWDQQPFDYNQLVCPLLEEILKQQGLVDCVELNVKLTDDATIQQLNKQFRYSDNPTNVLSFPCHDQEDSPFSLAEEPLQLGDIVLAYETIEQETREQNKTFKDHLIHLLIHATLHILGFDHVTEGQAEEMEELEIKILKKLNIANPYEENRS